MLQKRRKEFHSITVTTLHYIFIGLNTLTLICTLSGLLRVVILTGKGYYRGPYGGYGHGGYGHGGYGGYGGYGVPYGYGKAYHAPLTGYGYGHGLGHVPAKVVYVAPAVNTIAAKQAATVARNAHAHAAHKKAHAAAAKKSYLAFSIASLLYY